MQKARIVTARIKFSARKHGADMSEEELSEYLSRQLEFAEGLRLETVLDGDPLKDVEPDMLKALKWAIGMAEEAIVLRESSADPDDMECLDLHRAELDAARSAITKAERRS